MSLLKAEGVAKRYGRHVALEPVSLEVGPGETVALLGPNGAGKTTLLSLLAGATSPSAGRVRRPPDSQTGWVPQQPALYSRLTPRENLRLFARLERLADSEAACERLLRAVDLVPVADRAAGDLSVGNRQRLNVAIGLLGDPTLLFLDEPTAALDPRQRLVLWAILQDVAARGGAVVFATHNVEEAHLYADHLAVLHDGRLVFFGGQDELLARAGVEETGGGFERALVTFLDGAAAEAVG